MHYLECIAMLNYLLKKLHSGQRTQVPVTVVDDVQQVMVQLSRKLEKETDVQITARIRDVMEALAEVSEVKGALVLTDTMKSALVSGLTELLTAVQLATYEYYKYNDFEPTPEIVEVMRGVVATALDKGLL